MLKSILRISAAFILCILLVYAPEIYGAVSDPYEAAHFERILLRVVLCTQDTDSAEAFYEAMNIYMKQSPLIHLRITRADAQQLFSLPDPQPDVFVFPETIAYDESQYFASAGSGDASARRVARFFPGQGEALLCGVHIDSTGKDAAFALLKCLESVSFQTAD